MSSRTKVINLFGGPGVGKSTTAAGLFYLMKTKEYSVELVTEYAKDKVWENSLGVLGNQFYILAKQEHRLWRLKDKVDYIITDSPILLSLHYSNKDPIIVAACNALYGAYDNINIQLERAKKYVEVGRLQTKEQAIDIDTSVQSILEEYGYINIVGDSDAPERILEHICQT